MLDVKAASLGIAQAVSKMSNRAKALNSLDKNILSINRTSVQASLGTSNENQNGASIKTGQTITSLANDGSAIVGINIDLTA
tara:strand:- start:138 stop:383 length:246 start_codon:yes stop_codon:yes gene_type:complete